jgi:hypothetical protein
MPQLPSIVAFALHFNNINKGDSDNTVSIARVYPSLGFDDKVEDVIIIAMTLTPKGLRVLLRSPVSEKLL